MDIIPTDPIFLPEYAWNVLLNEHERQHLALSLTGYFVGHMPLPQFFADHFPGAQVLDDGNRTLGDYEAFGKSKKEREMYGPWAAAMQQEDLPVNTAILISSDATTELSKLKPDNGLQVPPNDQVSRHRMPGPTSRVLKAAFNFMTMDFVVEGKFEDEVMPFTLVWVAGASIESQGGSSARGQLALYAAKQMVHQHRTAVYQVILNRKFAQIVRWDRAGAIVSESFDPTVVPWVPRLVRAYYQMGRRERGHDITVLPASPSETRHYRTAIPLWLFRIGRNQAQIEEYLGMPSKLPVEKVAVTDERSPSKVRYVLTSQPFYSEYGPLGYGMRLYLAVNPDGPEVYTMRDSWRVDGTVSEYATYRALFDAGVSHTFQVESGGDVFEPGETEPQKTTTQDAAASPDNAPWRGPCNGPPKMHARVHQRHLEPVGFPVHLVKSCRELLMVFRDALHAVKDSWDKLRLIHGDITPKRIQWVLREGGGITGILCGWHNAHRYKERAGYAAATSQFMSIRLMKAASDGAAVHPELIDEVESWFWCFVYAALVYIEPKNDRILMQDGDFFSPNKEQVNAKGKITSLDYIHKEGYLRNQLHEIKFTCRPLSDIFQLFVRTWRNYYSLLSVDEEFRSPEFASLAATVADPQWYLHQIELALKQLGWEGQMIRGLSPAKDQLSKKDQPSLSQAVRIQGLPHTYPAGKATPPTVVNAVGKTTDGTRVSRKASTLTLDFNIGNKRPADGDLRSAGDKENSSVSVHPPILVAPPTRMSPEELARRTRKLKKLPPQVPAPLPGPKPGPVPLASGDPALAVPDDADVQMTAASALPQAPSSTAQDVLQHISAPQTPKRKKGGFLQKVRDTVTPKKTKEADQPLSPVKAKTPMRGLVRRMRGKGK
ncbi:hypothetical protein PsYK624_082240 [Phanerochaete sordida]|uniref:Fungal-type protein kinase domain-containing protein n=1 Tax=Phanerochaete sordida TaxID=48140 RepID=A0A9P3GC73_9APHY|nr:hypothetical protein PsYK624_082240 [Phanerochaete sordida]